MLAQVPYRDIAGSPRSPYKGVPHGKLSFVQNGTIVSRPKLRCAHFFVVKQKLFIFCSFFLRYFGVIHHTTQTVACLTHVTLSCFKLEVVPFPIIDCCTVQNTGRQNLIVLSKTGVFFGFFVVIRVVVIILFCLFKKLPFVFIPVDIQVFQPKLQQAHGCRVVMLM